jgi:hypothetical protein
VLGPGGSACQGFSEGPASLAGQSNEAVQWNVELFDGDGDDLGSGFTVVSTSIDNTVSPSGGAFYVEGCVSNTWTTTATVSLSLTPRQ